MNPSHRRAAELPPPPASEEALLERAHELSGCKLGEIAARFDITPPENLKRHKGFVGQLLERALGATAASRPTPDFPALGVELKTLPIDHRGLPQESTFICTAELEEVAGAPWKGSRVHAKLHRVLWIPVEASPRIPVADRRVGTGMLWSPQPAQEAVLRRDWEILQEFIAPGYVDALTAHRGQALQIRPKAAHAGTRRTCVDAQGDLYETLPRGFYLRRSFTTVLLRDTFGPPSAGGRIET